MILSLYCLRSRIGTMVHLVYHKIQEKKYKGGGDLKVSSLRVLLDLGVWLLLQDKVMAHNSFPHISYFVYDRLEV